jgi:hypothetical protein
MFSKTLTAIALATAVTVGGTAQSAHATAWYDASLNCRSIEDLYKVWSPSTPAASTPDDILRDMSVFAGIQDVTTKFTKEARTDIDPQKIRVIDFGGDHGVHMFLTNRHQCLGLAASLSSNR